MRAAVLPLGLFVVVAVLVSTPSGSVLTDKPIVRQTSQAESFSLPLNWKGLVPLQSNRPDVERVLGSPSRSYGQLYVYENETERVSVWYSSGNCNRGPDSWRVAAGTVTRLEVFPHKSSLNKELVFDRSKFERRQWSSPNNWVTYSNEEDGISIEVTALGGDAEEVRSFVYKPKPNNRHLKCD